MNHLLGILWRQVVIHFFQMDGRLPMAKTQRSMSIRSLPSICLPGAIEGEAQMKRAQKYNKGAYERATKQMMVRPMVQPNLRNSIKCPHAKGSAIQRLERKGSRKETIQDSFFFVFNQRRVPFNTRSLRFLYTHYCYPVYLAVVVFCTTLRSSLDSLSVYRWITTGRLTQRWRNRASFRPKSWHTYAAKGKKFAFQYVPLTTSMHERPVACESSKVLRGSTNASWAISLSYLFVARTPKSDFNRKSG